MQKKVQIVSDGSLDLPQEITDAHDIEVVPFYVSFNGETYQKEIEEIGIREFYQEMVDHPDVFPKSSMASDSQLLQSLYKRRLCVVCRRLCKMLLTVKLFQRKFTVLIQSL